MTVFPYKHGKPLVWYATFSDTYAATIIGNTTLQPAYAANDAEASKQEKYRNLTDRYLLQPIAVETTGVFGQSTGAFLNELGRRMVSETGDA